VTTTETLQSLTQLIGYSSVLKWANVHFLMNFILSYSIRLRLLRSLMENGSIFSPVDFILQWVSFCLRVFRSDTKRSKAKKNNTNKVKIVYRSTRSVNYFVLYPQKKLTVQPGPSKRNSSIAILLLLVTSRRFLSYCVYFRKKIIDDAIYLKINNLHIPLLRFVLRRVGPETLHNSVNSVLWFS